MNGLVRTGYVKTQGKFTAAYQRRILEQAGVRKIIEDNGKDFTLKEALNMLRGDEVLETVGGFRPFGPGRYTITGQLEILRTSGKVVMDYLSGLRSDRDGAMMLSMALAKAHRERLMPTHADASRRGRNGAKVRWADKERMPIDQAKAIWLNTKKHRTNAKALRHMPGWTESEAYRHLGAPGRPAGNPGIRKLNQQRKSP